MPEQTLPQSTASAERLLARLLDLIISCDTIADFTPARVSKAMARELQPRPDRSFGVIEQLTADWRYSLTVSPDFFLGPRVSFFFVDNDGGYSGSMTDVCGLGFDRLAARLQTAGFVRAELYGEHGRPRGELFQRNGLRVEVLTRGESNDPDTIADSCIWSLQVS